MKCFFCGEDSGHKLIVDNYGPHPLYVCSKCPGKKHLVGYFGKIGSLDKRKATTKWKSINTNSIKEYLERGILSGEDKLSQKSKSKKITSKQTK